VTFEERDDTRVIKIGRKDLKYVIRHDEFLSKGADRLANWVTATFFRWHSLRKTHSFTPFEF